MTITDWPENEAFKRLIEASLIFQDINGTNAWQGFLQAELARATVIAGLAARHMAHVTTASDKLQQTTEDLDTALRTLEFYGNPDNYRPRKGAPSKVATDCGKRARDAFEAISGDEDGEAE